MINGFDVFVVLFFIGETLFHIYKQSQGLILRLFQLFDFCRRSIVIGILA